MAHIRRIFPGGNTASGLYSFHDNIIGDNRNMLYIIKGMPGGGKSSLMRDIGNRMMKKGYEIEYHHCPSDPDSIDGLAINKLKVGIVDGTPPHGMDPIYPKIKDKIINIERFIDEKKLVKSREDIINAKANNKYAYGKAFKYFKAAETVYELIEESNIKYVNHKEVNKKGIELIKDVFHNKEQKIEYDGFNIRHLFSAAYTPEGFVDYTETILETIENIYFIQSEIGIGEQNILDTILGLSKLKNYQIELFYNPLMPERIESIFIKDLNTIVTTNTKGEDFANSILDLSQYLDFDKIEKEDYGTFSFLIKKGMEFLKDAKKNHFLLEKAYRPTIDYSQINTVREEIYKEILSYIV